MSGAVEDVVDAIGEKPAFRAGVVGDVADAELKISELGAMD